MKKRPMRLFVMSEARITDDVKSSVKIRPGEIVKPQANMKFSHWVRAVGPNGEIKFNTEPYSSRYAAKRAADGLKKDFETREWVVINKPRIVKV